MNDLILDDSFGIVAIVGALLPFLLPTLFRFLEDKIFKRALSKQEKRDTIMGISAFVSILIVAINYDFTPFSWGCLWSFVTMLGLKFGVLQGFVNTIYNNFISRFEDLKRSL